MLTAQQKKTLRQLANDMKPYVYIGKNGITDTVLETFETALYAHNLVKVSLQKEATVSVHEVERIFTETFACELVHKVGRVLIFYRYNPKGNIVV